METFRIPETEEESFKLIKYVAGLNDNLQVRRILIDVVANWSKLPNNHKDIWEELLETEGFYPYLMRVRPEYREASNADLGTLIRVQASKSEVLPDVYYTDKQTEALRLLRRGNNLLLEAPTSFGKSLLILDLVASEKFDNIVIIQPSLALIQETKRKIKQLNLSHSIITHSKQKQNEKNIFILTPERVLETDFSSSKPDLLVYDEFYKITGNRSDTRITISNLAFYELVTKFPDIQIYLLSPSVSEISPAFIKKYNLELVDASNYSMVNTVQIQHNPPKRGKKQWKYEKVREIVTTYPNSQFLVYVRSPRAAIEYAKLLKDSFDAVEDLEVDSLVSWVKDNISENWNFTEFVQHGVGMHNGRMPRHLNDAQVELFQEKKLRVLFTTTTLIEGVNTNAEHIILADLKKGSNNPLDYMDIQNVKGRAGRMMQYYTGFVHFLEHEPQPDPFTLNVPIVNQESASDDLLIHLQPLDVLPSERSRYESLNQPSDEFDGETISALKGLRLPMEDLKKIYVLLKEEFSKDNDFFKVPTSLDKKWLVGKLRIIGGVFTNNDDEKYWYVYAGKMLAVLYSNSFEKDIIAMQIAYYKKKSNKPTEDIVSDAIFDTFEFLRNQAGVEFPKYFRILETMQIDILKHAQLDPEDYTGISQLIENIGMSGLENMFVENGLPASTAKKISRLIPADKQEYDVAVKYIFDNYTMITNSLSSYETRKLNNL